MKVYYVATYPPRQCGIGTFTNNLLQATDEYTRRTAPSAWSAVAAVEDQADSERSYPPEVRYRIDNSDPRAYVRAAQHINNSGADICVIQHEYGIFGGDDGVRILDLAEQLRIPFIVTFHTILEHPSFAQRIILQRLATMAYGVVVMSRRAERFLREIYHVEPDRIHCIEHGVPNGASAPREILRRRFNWTQRQVLMTFGLLGRNKGIETVLRALPPVVEKHPGLLYLVLGNTHPNVVREEGEAYRESLLALVDELGLRGHVVFQTGFLSEAELFDYLTATDMYVTPYLSRTQITSGTLAYAVGAGAAVLSTPYWHAEELLDDGRGILFDFHDDRALTEHLLALLDEPDRLATYRQRAADYAEGIRWRVAGRHYHQLFGRAAQHYYERLSRKGPQGIDHNVLPRIEMDHLKRLTDDTGIVQHACYGVPNLKEGYCIDDNSRALIAALMAYRQLKDREVRELLPIYLSYISYMQTPQGNFRNFLTFSRQYVDLEGSDDAYGRTLWSLGYLLAHAPNEAYLELGSDIFRRALPHAATLRSVRGAANSIIGLYYYLHRYPNERAAIEHLQQLADFLCAEYEQAATADWRWFEEVMTYDNALLPLALWLAADVVRSDRYRHIAEATTAFLESVILPNGQLSVVGNDGWYPRGGRRSVEGQQPTDAMAAVLLFQGAYRISGDPAYLLKMYQCFLWFTGRNDQKISLYDPETKGCCDGLELYGLNRNQGAESTLAYLISRLVIQEMLPELQRVRALPVTAKATV